MQNHDQEPASGINRELFTQKSDETVVFCLGTAKLGLARGERGPTMLLLALAKREC